MGARSKINGLVGLGIVAVAGFFGLAVQSWVVLFIVAAVLVGFCILSGDIRLDKPDKRRRRR